MKKSILMVIILSALLVSCQRSPLSPYVYYPPEDINDGLDVGSLHEVNMDPVLIEKADKLLANSITLKKTAQELGQHDSASEAAQMESYMVRIKEILEKGGREKHLLTMLLARFYLHYNNCIMNYPGYLKIMVKDHVEEVRNALGEGRIQDVIHLGSRFGESAEHSIQQVEQHDPCVDLQTCF